MALIAVLEALDPPHPEAAAAGRRQLICVANTHIHANPELNDVKLWQVRPCTLWPGFFFSDVSRKVGRSHNACPCPLEAKRRQALASRPRTAPHALDVAWLYRTRSVFLAAYPQLLRTALLPGVSWLPHWTACLGFALGPSVLAERYTLEGTVLSVPSMMRLRQVHTLLKGLEKIAASADIPMRVAGDFNSVPGSAAHSLLVKRSVDPGHPVRAMILGFGLRVYVSGSSAYWLLV